MKLRNIVATTSLLLGTATFSFTAGLDDIYTSVVDSESTTVTSSLISSDLITPFKKIYSYITNENNTWGPQDRTDQWYVGVGATGLAQNVNSRSGAAANFILGYNINKYFVVQYNQIVGKHFAGIGEGIINLSNSTMFTPYAVAGAGWGNLSGKATGVWDVGGGFKFELSKNFQASVDYRYIQTMALNPVVGNGSQLNARGSNNLISAGVTWFFGGKSNTNNDTGNIQDNDAIKAAKKISIPSVNEIKYMLPKDIQQCEGNYSLTKDGVACYTVNGDDVTVYLDTKFTYDKVDLNEKGKKAISSFVNFIKDSNIDSVTVKGYASQGQVSEEFENYNQTLSEKRAEAVADYMKEQGLDSEKIVTKGFGYNDTLEGVDKSDASNQRVNASASAPLKEDK